MRDYTHLEIDWTETRGGNLMSVGSPSVFGWLRAVYLPGVAFADGGVRVLARADDRQAWTEYHRPLGGADADALAGALALLGLPAAAPRVEAVPSTVQVWSACHVRVAIRERVGAFSVHAEANGFEGLDAAPLRRIFRRVYALAGYDDRHSIFYDHRDDRP